MPLTAEVVIDPTASFDRASELTRLMVFAAGVEPSVPGGDWSLTIRITDDETITDVHARFFGDPTPTDVISFPSGECTEASVGYLGDILVSIDTAAEQAHAAGHPPGREVAYLALHGLLHLCGADDQSPDERRQMLEAQERILKAFEAVLGVSW